VNRIVYVALIVILVFAPFTIQYCIYYDKQIVFGQTNKTKIVGATKTHTTYGTFSAVGRISSLIFDNNTVMDISSARKVILTGDWSINVNNGNVSFFEADFVAAPADGSVSHMHELVNLLVKDAQPILITSNGNASIVGTIDVKLNGISFWNDVKTTILISKGSTISISLNDEATHHHFMKQPIYGMVDRLSY
jgi:hypothetical protein